MSGIYSGIKVRVVAKELDGGQQADVANTTTAWGNETYKAVENGSVADDTTEAQVLRLTERSLSLEKNLLETEEVRTSRMQSDVRHGFTTATASLGFEIASPKDTPAGTAPYDGGQKMLMQAVLENAVAGASVTVSGGSASGGYNLSSGTASFGDVLYADGNAQVVTSNSYNANSSLTCDKATGASDLSTSVYRAEAMTIGNGVPRAYVLERVFSPDTTGGDYISETFVNCVGNSLNISISPEAIATGTVEFISTASLGMSTDTNEATATFFDSPTAPGSTPVYAAFDGAVFEGGTALAIVTSVEFTINNNRTTEARIGSKFADCVFDATCQVEGTMSVFFAGPTQYNKFVEETPSRLLVVLRDPNNDGALLAISCPNVKYNGGTIDPPQEGPITMEMPFRALEGNNGESAIKIVNVNYDA